MTNEEFQKLVLEQLTRLDNRMGNFEGRMGNIEGHIGNIEGRMGNIEGRMDNFEGRMGNFEEGLSEVKQSLVRIEHDHGSKISALFDGYSMRGDQIEQLKDHLDDRLDVIQTDIAFILGKIAQQEKSIVQLNKKAK